MVASCKSFHYLVQRMLIEDNQEQNIRTRQGLDNFRMRGEKTQQSLTAKTPRGPIEEATRDTAVI